MSSLVGKAGEYAVATQLLLRGIDVGFMAVGTGVDLMAVNGCRIQVKSGHIRTGPSTIALYGYPVYTMHFPKHRMMPVAAGVNKLVPRRKLAELCDVVVYWGIEENRFWIIPASICDVRQCVVLGPSNARSFDKELPEMKAMVEMGFSQKDIGERFGITQASTWKRLHKDGTQKHGESVVCSIRACENAWGNILDFCSTEAVIEKEIANVT